MNELQAKVSADMPAQSKLVQLNDRLAGLYQRMCQIDARFEESNYIYRDQLRVAIGDPRIAPRKEEAVPTQPKSVEPENLMDMLNFQIDSIIDKITRLDDRNYELSQLNENLKTLI